MNKTHAQMNTPELNPVLQRAVKILKPWFLWILLFLVLRFTGGLSVLSGWVQGAALNLGFRDASTSGEALVKKKFDYNFTLRTLDGQVVDAHDWQGKVVFLNLWATWCGPCRAEMPSIQSLYESVGHDQVVFVMLSLDHDQPQEKVQKYIRDKAYTFPVYLPEESLPDLLQVSSIPTTFVINAAGEVVSHETGAANYNTPKFRKFLDGLQLKAPAHKGSGE